MAIVAAAAGVQLFVRAVGVVAGVVDQVAPGRLDRPLQRHGRATTSAARRRVQATLPGAGLQALESGDLCVCNEAGWRKIPEELESAS